MAMTILEAMESPKLFQKTFRKRGSLRKTDSWGAWKVFLAGLFGLPMDPASQEIWFKHTGREVSAEAFLEAYVIAGRRSGKSIVSALVATFAATFKNYAAIFIPGETGQ